MPSKEYFSRSGATVQRLPSCGQRSCFFCCAVAPPRENLSKKIFVMKSSV
jgi:hypothetical protein